MNNHAAQASIIQPNFDLSFRGIRDKKDYPLLLDINLSSRKADHDDQPVTLEDMVQSFSPSEELNPSRDVLIAFVDGDPQAAIGYSRLGWYSSQPNNRLYYIISRLKSEYRKPGVWKHIIQQSEQRIREIAQEHAPVDHRFFQAWASDNQPDWTSALENSGYAVVRRFNNMLHSLENIPEKPLPAGFEIRPVKPEHMRQVWEAQKEMNEGLFENVAEDWVEEKFSAWLENPTHTPQFWQVAWAGDQLAGMVLNRIDEEENKKRNRKHSYTEHICVRAPWRNHGLASALISLSLQILKAQGMDEAELGVDSENESAAFSLYQRMGYKTFSIDTWFRKPMD